jgi:hypothetical protein
MAIDEEPCDLLDVVSVLDVTRSDLSALVRLQTLLDLHGIHLSLIDGAVVVVQLEGQTPSIEIISGHSWQWSGHHASDAGGGGQDTTWREALMIEVQGSTDHIPLSSISDLRLKDLDPGALGMMLADLHLRAFEGKIYSLPSR